MTQYFRDIAKTRLACPTVLRMERYIEMIPEVMIAYEEAKATGKYNVFDSYPIVTEMNRRMCGEVFIDTLQFQAMVLRFVDNPDHYRRSLASAQRRVAMMASVGAGTGTGAGTSTGADIKVL